MATKECPYCHKEIADEAILCKYCHNLLIGSNQDIESAAIAGRERAKHRNAVNASNAVDQALGRKPAAPRSSDEELTREFSTVDAAELEEKTRAFTVPKQPAPQRPAAQPKRPEPQPARQPGPQPSRQPAAQSNDRYYDDDDRYYDDNDGYYDDTYPQDERYEDNRRSAGRNYDDDDRYDDDGRYYEDEDYEDSSDKKKKIFIITALITVSVIAVVALAIFVGYKLVGFAKNDSSSNPAITRSSSITRATKYPDSSSDSSSDSEKTTTTTKKSETEQTTDTETGTETQPTETETQPTETETQSETQPTQSETQQSETQPTQQSETQPTQQSETQPTQQSDTQPTQTQPSGTDQAQILANVSAALSYQNASGIKSYEYRSEDAGAVYLYVFTNDDHAYSVAYFKATGQSTIVQAW